MLILRKISPLGLLAVVACAGCRQDMHDQPRFKPLAKSDFYADMRSARAPVEGTVARGQLHEDSYFYTGKIGNESRRLLAFSRDPGSAGTGAGTLRYFCAPCHSRMGDGNGTVPARGFPRKPPSYHIERLRKAPLGYFYDVMTNGFGIMPDYASQIPARDRWCIVAYIKALQLSQKATLADVPPGQTVPSAAAAVSSHPDQAPRCPTDAASLSPTEQEPK